MNLLENTKRDEMVSDGWVITSSKNDDLTKWTIENKKYGYRDHYTRYKINWDSGINELIRNLKIRIEMGYIRLPYEVKVNMGMEGRKKV